MIDKRNAAAAAWVVLGSLCAMAAAADPQAVVRLPERYTAPADAGETIRLGALAEAVVSDDPALRLKLQALEVMDTPPSGEIRRLAQHQVVMAMRVAGIDFYRVGFEGARLIEVRGPGQTVPLRAMVEAIQRKILAETGWNPEEISLQILSAPTREPWLPAGRLEMTVERVNRQILGSTRYTVRFLIGKIMVEEVQFIAHVARKRMVFFPVGNPKRGDVITEDSIRGEIQLIDGEHLDRLYAGSADELIGKRFRVDPKPYEPIRYNALETNFVVRRGDRVQMIVRDGGFVLRTSAVVQERAAPGDVVPVKAAVTGMVLKARVINKNLVEKTAS